MLYDFAERVRQLERAGKRIVKLNLGEPDVPIDSRIIAAAVAGLQKGESPYESSAGMPELREALAQRHGVEPENIVVTPGSKWALFALFSTLLRPGDRVIVPSPHWTAIELQLRKLGAAPVLVKTTVEQRWQPTVEQIEREIAGAKVVLLTTPGNPTSTVMGQRELAAVAELCAENGVRLVTDECYAELAFKPPASAIGKGIVLKSFSKTFSMAGFRIGYVVAPAETAAAIAVLNTLTISSLPGFIQRAALRAVELWDEVAERTREVYRRRAKMAAESLAGLRMAAPEAGFYAFPEVGDGAKLAEQLLESGIAVTPGAAFGEFPAYARISLTAPDRELAEALGKIAAASRKGD